MSAPKHTIVPDTETIKSCTLKMLPPELWVSAAERAIQINQMNAPAVSQFRQAAPEAVIEPAHLALLTSKYWGIGGVQLTVGFMDAAPANLRTKILSHMNAWGLFCNVQFVETGANAHVRISRTAGDGYWSYLGTDILSIPANRPTMNLDSFSMSTPDSEFFRVVRHETGHTLGFPHEHMRADIVNRIDREKAIAYFMRTQNWTRQQVIDQVLTVIPQSALLSTAHADPNSIMCYWLPAEIMSDGIGVPGGTDIDPLDADFANTVYPRHAWHWADQGTPPGKTVVEGIGAITMMNTPTSEQRPYVFVKTNDNHLWVNWWDNGWHWSDQGTPPGRTIETSMGVITVKSTPADQQRPYAFVKTTDGHLWVNWWDGHAWHWAEQGTPPGKTIAQKVGAITMMTTPGAQQRPYVFVLTNDHQLWANWWDGSAWHWGDLGSPTGKLIDMGLAAITVMDTPTSTQRPHVFVRTGDGDMWVKWWDGSAWHWANQGKPFGKYISGKVGAITMMNTPTSAQRPYIFVYTSDGHLCVNWFDGGWHWADQGTPPGRMITTGMGAITMMNTPGSQQRPYAFVRATDGHLCVNWWDGASWHWGDQGTPVGKMVNNPAGAITMMNTTESMQRPYIFVQSNDSKLCVNWWS